MNRLLNLINRQLFTTDRTLSYDRITDAIVSLAMYIRDHDCDSSEAFELIAGAYWHYANNLTGQWSTGYAALSALSAIYRPGAGDTGLNDYYEALNNAI